MTKMTNKTALAYVVENYAVPDEVREKLEGMIAQLEKKNAGSRKPTKTQIENEGYKALMLEVMSDQPMTVTDVMKAVPEFAEFSNQKVAALMKGLFNEGKVTKTTEKGRSYFAKC